jgi:hypothetical protein
MVAGLREVLGDINPSGAIGQDLDVFTHDLIPQLLQFEVFFDCPVNPVLFCLEAAIDVVGLITIGFAHIHIIQSVPRFIRIPGIRGKGSFS